MAVKTSQNPKSVPVVCLYGNAPEPLAVQVICLAGRSNRELSGLVYWDRGDSVVAMPLSNELSDRPMTVVRMPVGSTVWGKCWYRILVMIKLTHAVLKMKPEVVHAWNFDMMVCACVLKLLSVGKIRYIAVLQDTSQWMRRWWSRPFQRWVYGMAEAVWAMSNSFIEEFLHKDKLVSVDKPCLFLPNVPPRSRFADVRRRNERGSLVVGCIGLLRGEQGLATLVDAVARARLQGCDIQIQFSGKGQLVDRIRALAEDHAFIRYSGPYGHEDLPELYNKVDLLYAVYDNTEDKKIHLAYRFCEAVNCGIPIICSRGSHMGTLAEHKGVGFATGLGSTDELCELLVRLFHCRELIEDAGGRSRLFKEQFCFENYESSILRSIANAIPPVSG
jgi:glycosyltransferase involved in cell wall biosynthesis